MREREDEEGGLTKEQQIHSAWRVYAGCLHAAGRTVSQSWEDLNEDDQEAFTAAFAAGILALEAADDTPVADIAIKAFVAFQNHRTAGHPGHTPLTYAQGRVQYEQLPPEERLAWFHVPKQLYNAAVYHAEDHGSLADAEEQMIEVYKAALDRMKGQPS